MMASGGLASREMSQKVIGIPKRGGIANMNEVSEQTRVTALDTRTCMMPPDWSASGFWTCALATRRQ